MISRKKAKQIGIGFVAILVGTGAITGFLKKQGKEKIKETEAVVSLKMNERELYANQYNEDHPVIVFANQAVEEHAIEGVATVPINTVVIDKDAYGRYLTEVNVVGIDKENNTSIYTYYIIIEGKEELNVKPYGIEVFKDELDAVKRNLIVSMMKVLNGWGDSM